MRWKTVEQRHRKQKGGTKNADRGGSVPEMWVTPDRSHRSQISEKSRQSHPETEMPGVRI